VKPTDFGFPYESYRDCQLDALKWALDQGDKSVLLLEAPPGVGKSLIGATWAQAVGGDHGLIVTRTLSLLDQYENQLGLPSIRGAGNFECSRSLLHKPTSCEDGMVQGCPHIMQDCPYSEQRRAGEAAQCAVTSYSYALTGGKGKASHLVCDEGHALLDVLTEYQSITVPWSLDPPTTMENLPEWAKWKLPRIEVPDAESNPAGYRRARDIVRNLERLKLWSPYGPNPHIMGETSRSLLLQPLWPTPSLFHGMKTLVMSATLYGGVFLAELFGFAQGNWAFKFVKSPFDPARRPFYLLPCGSLTRGADANDYRRMAKGIRGVIQHHPNQKGLIHLSSYKQIERLRPMLGKLPILFHSGQTREGRAALFRQFRTASPPCWLMSPSAREGEDFPYDAARVNIIGKIPYPDLGDPVVSARQADGKRGKAYYAAVTCGNLAQAYGRAMRAEDDWGLTYCLDEGIFKLLRYSRGYLPQYLLEAMVRL
jgi:Rad3-related DNA helicase